MKKLTIWLMALSLSVAVYADTIKIGTGSTTGNYYQMMNDLAKQEYCGGIGQFQVLKSEGSIDNLLGMGNKKYSMAVVQSDVLMNYSKTSPQTINLNQMKVIAGLHVETVHLLIPVGYRPAKTESSNLFGSVGDLFSSSKPKPVKLSSLKGQAISSWGGSLVSAKALSYFFGLNWSVYPVNQATAANANTPILLVGGAPYKPVEELLATGKWRLLPIDYSEISQRAPFYVKSNASYMIGGKAQSVQTVGVQALLMGKAFRNAERNLPAEKFATCIEKNLADLADDSNTNSNWTSVYELSKKGQTVNWAYFNQK